MSPYFCHVTLICPIRTPSAYEVIFFSENGRVVTNDYMIEYQVLVSSGRMDMQHCMERYCIYDIVLLKVSGSICT